MSQKALKQISDCFGAKVGLIWIPTFEEIQVERAIAKEAQSYKKPYKVQIWSATSGLEPFLGPGSLQPANNSLHDEPDDQSPIEALKKASSRTKQRIITIFRDLNSFLENPLVLRAAKDAHRRISELSQEQAKQIVIIDHNEPPNGLHGVIVIDWPLPDRDELVQVFSRLMKVLPDNESQKTEDEVDKIVGAGLGLDSEEFEVAITRCYVSTGKIIAEEVAKEKERIVRGGGLIWSKPDARGMNGIGGLELMKKWLKTRRTTLTKAARDYGLPAPKGILLVGPPGAGKSLTAKCVAATWELPYLKLDMSMMFGSLLGESEQRVNRALQTAEAVAPCILHIDEVEKALAHGDRDGGTSFRIFGRFLSWMQDHKDGVFVVATANQIERMPPEFLRAGRWDQIWLIDLPTTTEREAIVEVMKKKYKHCDKVDKETVSGEMRGFTGAEIEAAFVNALTTAYSDNERDVKDEDIIHEARMITPISKSMEEQIKTMRRDLQSIARPASLQELAPTGSIGRDISNLERGGEN